MNGIKANGAGMTARFKRISKTRRMFIGAAVLVVVLLLGYWVWTLIASATAKPPAPASISVETALAARQDFPIYEDGLGTVQALYTVTVTARVDGRLDKVAFTEGQMVKKGDLLAQIDPRTYKAALDLANATREKDLALLANAKQDLQRYQILAPQDFTSKQTVDTQRSLVAQLEAQVKGDQATVDNAETLLDYTTITSPIDGRTGIRLVDPGNNVRASDTAGIVVVTEMQPANVVFTLPEEALPAVTTAMKLGPVSISAMSRDGKTELAQGVISLIDNQIDQATGTIRLKATFPNRENTLWPGEFVNARILVQTLHNVLTIPVAGLQRGPTGVFTYLVKPDSTVAVQPLTTSGESPTFVVVDQGLTDGTRVVTSNQYKLQAGAHVKFIPVKTAAKTADSGTP